MAKKEFLLIGQRPQKNYTANERQFYQDLSHLFGSNLVYPCTPSHRTFSATLNRVKDSITLSLCDPDFPDHFENSDIPNLLFFNKSMAKGTLRLRFMPNDLDYNQKQKQKQEIVDIILECPSIKNEKSRSVLLGELPPHIANVIKASDCNKEHVLNIVNTCMNHADGLELLIERLRFLDGRTTQFQTLTKFIDNNLRKDLIYHDIIYHDITSDRGAEILHQKKIDFGYHKTLLIHHLFIQEISNDYELNDYLDLKAQAVSSPLQETEDIVWVNPVCLLGLSSEIKTKASDLWNKNTPLLFPPKIKPENVSMLKLVIIVVLVILIEPPDPRLFRDPLKGGDFSPEMVSLPISMADIYGRGGEQLSFKSFAISRYEITVEEYKLFVDATNRQTSVCVCGQKEYDKDQGNYPVTNVSWKDATDYATWLSKKTGKKYRLPTET